MTEDVNSKVSERVATVATLNDRTRSNVLKYVATRGIMSLNSDVVADIFFRVQKFSDFTEDNDPYGEHDFGSFTVSGIKIFWKIDYYDERLEHWCDPLDPRCRRILTIMKAEEY